MFRRFMKTRLAVVGLAAVGALALAVGAYAYFTSNGTGTSSATAGSPSTYTVTVTPAATTTDGTVTLYPTTTGDSNFTSLYQPYTGVVTNNNSGHEQVSKLTAAITSVTPTTGNTCAASNFTLYSPNSHWTVATGGQTATTDSTNTAGATTPALPDDMAGSGTLTYKDIGVYLVDESSDQNGCQGATVNVSVTAS